MAGQKGSRFALPNSSILLTQPRSRARGQASDIAIRAREILSNRRTTNAFLAQVPDVLEHFLVEMSLGTNNMFGVLLA